MDNLEGLTIYLLFDGSSCDGRGSPDYVGRTLDFEVAKKHWYTCYSNPYSVGKIAVLTEDKLDYIVFGGDMDRLERERNANN